MKKSLNTKLLLLLLSILFTSMSCERDENGNRITYYKNKTGEGYVFYKFDNDSIAPIMNAKTQIQTYVREMFVNADHFDYVYTDNKGKYSFKCVKKINGKKVVGGWIYSPIGDSIKLPLYGIGIELNYHLLDNFNNIFIDTIFFNPDKP